MSFTNIFLDVFLLSGGVIRDSDYRIYERIVTITITVASFVSWYGTIVAIVNISKVADKFETILYLITVPTCYFASYYVRKNRQKLSQFVEHIRQLSTGDDNDVMKRIDNSFRNILKKISIAVYATSVFFSLPLWITLFSRDYRNTISFVPRWLECAENVTADRFTINTLCLQVDSYSKRVSSNFIQWAFCWVYSMPSITVILFYVFIHKYVKFHRQYLQNTLDEIRARRQVALFTRGDQSSQNIRSDLVDVMKQYQSLYRSMQLVSPFMTDSFRTFIASSFLILVWCCYMPFNSHEIGSSSWLAFQLRYVGILPLDYAGIFFLCLVGEYLLQTNSVIAQSVYNLPWHAESIVTKKLVCQFLIILNRPIATINFYGSTVPSLNLALHFTRTGYSVVNFLIATTNRRDN